MPYPVIHLTVQQASRACTSLAHHCPFRLFFLFDRVEDLNDSRHFDFASRARRQNVHLLNSIVPLLLVCGGNESCVEQAFFGHQQVLESPTQRRNSSCGLLDWWQRMKRTVPARRGEAVHRSTDGRGDPAPTYNLDGSSECSRTFRKSPERTRDRHLLLSGRERSGKGCRCLVYAAFVRCIAGPKSVGPLRSS